MSERPTTDWPAYWQDKAGGVAPRPGHPGDAGFDLVVSETTTIPKFDFGQVPCGLAVQLPPGYWGLIHGRSSAWRAGLMVQTSIIDAGFRGTLYVDCFNLSVDPILVAAGSRIAQLVPMPLAPRFEWVQRDLLDDSARGEGGYGSTGT